MSDRDGQGPSTPPVEKTREAYTARVVYGNGEGLQEPRCGLNRMRRSSPVMIPGEEIGIVDPEDVFRAVQGDRDRDEVGKG